jgi:quinol monooxygenase YgiN
MTRWISLAIAGLLVMAVAVMTPITAYAENSGGAVYVVTHVDVAPTGLGQGEGILRKFAADSRKVLGCVRFELLQQSDRNNHFALLEVWQDQAAFDAFTGADQTRQFRAQIQPLLGSPFDERVHHLLR